MIPTLKSVILSSFFLSAPTAGVVMGSRRLRLKVLEVFNSPGRQHLAQNLPQFLVKNAYLTFIKNYVIIIMPRGKES